MTGPRAAPQLLWSKSWFSGLSTVLPAWNIGCNYFVGQFAFGDLDLSEMLGSVALFHEGVMPELRVVERGDNVLAPAVRSAI